MANYTSTDLVADTEALIDRVRNSESLDLAETVGELLALVRLQSQFIHRMNTANTAPTDGAEPAVNGDRQE